MPLTINSCRRRSAAVDCHKCSNNQRLINNWTMDLNIHRYKHMYRCIFLSKYLRRKMRGWLRFYCHRIGKLRSLRMPTKRSKQSTFRINAYAQHSAHLFRIRYAHLGNMRLEIFVWFLFVLFGLLNSKQIVANPTTFAQLAKGYSWYLPQS